MRQRQITIERQARRALAVAALAAAAVLPCLASEHIVLRNGFELDCTAREVLDGRVRLYTGAGTASYIEVAADAIAQIEPLATSLPPASPVAQPSPALAEPVGAAPPPVSGVALRATRGPLAAPDLHALVLGAGRAHGIDADLLHSIIRAESAGDARAVSRTGARGLMQLMPATATAMGVADSFAPEQNVAGGAAYLDRLLTLYHDDIVLAVAAYNAGPGAVARFHGVPPYRETRLYVARVVREFNRRKLAAR